MNAEVYTSNLYWNTQLGKFFLSSQAYEQLERLVKIANDPQELFDTIDELFSNVDDLSNTLDYESEETLIDMIGTNLFKL